MKRTMISLLSILPLSFAACGGSNNSSSGGDCTPTAGSSTAKYVTNSVTVPSTKADYAIDLNGDGKPDNQLGSIVNILKTESLDVQMGVTQAVQEGVLAILATETSSDATFQTDSCAQTVIEKGTPVGPDGGAPDYSGTGMFTADSTGEGTFAGPITGGKFKSASPVTTKNPVSVTIQLPLIAGAKPVELDLQGAQIQYTRSASGTVTGGQLNGFVTNTNVQNKIIPNVAGLLTSKVQEMPQTSTDMQIASIFDNGGGTADSSCPGTCKNPGPPIGNGMCAVKGDNIIDICEVSTSGLIQQVLAPDIQMFDAAGNYSPTAANTMKDSLSMGMAFTFVGAQF